MHLLRSDLMGLYTDLADWIKKEPIAKSTDVLRAISLLIRPSQGLTAWALRGSRLVRRSDAAPG
jgi:hypothetical protein